MTPESTDLYAILGLTPRATGAELSRAYRALLRQHHPDTRTVEHGPSGIAADVTLQDVLTAYEILRDPSRRADYDRRRGVTAARATPQKIPVHRRHADPTLTSPIQAGPVHWHRTPER